MDKSPDAFRTISEVAEWLGVQAHVLRFWESKFTQVKPVKRAGGRRYYRPADMLLLGGIKKLLHDDGLTIKGVQKTLREQSVAHVSSLSQDLCDVAAEANAPAAPADTSAGGRETVVPFKSVASPSEPEPASSATPAGPGPEESAPEESTPDVTGQPGKPSPAPAPPVSTPPSNQTGPEADPGPEPVSVADEKPILPSFLHRPARMAQPHAPSDSPVTPPPEPEVAGKRPIVVDAPDPPDESELPYTRGALRELADLNRLTAAQVADIAPLAAQLQAWLSRSRGTGAS